MKSLPIWKIPSINISIILNSSNVTNIDIIKIKIKKKADRQIRTRDSLSFRHI